MAAIETFLTAYDPSDLPGTSIDPLGFERGYLCLAEKILPGLTNVANRPRYFSMLCAGAYLAGDLFSESPRQQYKMRLERITRLERFWALANVISWKKGGKNENALSGLRGVTYALAKADDILERGEKETDADFKLLARQVQYGAVGIYGTVADRMRFLDRQVLSLSPDLGEKLAKCFKSGTSLPKALQKALEQGGLVDVKTLESWGERAHIAGEVGAEEAACMRDALHLDPIRSRMVSLLEKNHEKQGESELKRLSKIYNFLKGNKSHLDLREAINAILYYEVSYRWALLALERILWLCRQDFSGAVSHDTLKNDLVMHEARENLPKPVRGLMRVLEGGTTDSFRKDLNRLEDVSMFLQEAASACEHGSEFVDSIIKRHAEVQRGKFDKGRRKMPWVEYVSPGKLALTSTRVGGLGFEATKASHIAPHPYRLSAADAMIQATRER